jgi:orotidine-5'-phosphate decarboxylase
MRTLWNAAARLWRGPEMTYQERLRHSAQAAGHILCLGIDPDLQRLPLNLGQWEEHVDRLLAALLEEGLRPAALKPNSAYFEAHGSAGFAWLERFVAKHRGVCPIILDAKRGDIGPSSRAYAVAAFDTIGADALTVSPWMGKDSLAPFTAYNPEKGVYALVRTSNPGTADLQQKIVAGEPAWQHLLRMLPQWSADGLGAVVGATGPQDLQWVCAQAPVPLLIPGVGAQGGEADQVMGLLRTEDASIHRVNVSSKILYAREDYPELSSLEASIRAFRRYSAELAL